jgi:hypothetical protein
MCWALDYDKNFREHHFDRYVSFKVGDIAIYFIGIKVGKQHSEDLENYMRIRESYF